MSLYVRVYNTFWGGRKTARLKARIGEAAYWVPIRLWNIAAEHQPDGNFSDYTAEELAALLSYNGNAFEMLQALLQAGFMDENPLRIHDWEEHNGYHATFASKAKLAAEARWEKERTKERDEKIRDERKGKEPSIAPSMLQASVEPPKNPSGELRAAATLLLLHLNKTASRSFQPRDETLKPIIRRLTEGCPPDELKKMIEREVAIQGASSKWLQTSTLFGKNFYSAYDDRNQPSKNGHAHQSSSNIGRPTIAQQRNAQISGADRIREEIKREAEKSGPHGATPDFLADEESPIPG
jgi:uncharacterized phage protein (TIGR02220 family)